MAPKSGKKTLNEGQLHLTKSTPLDVEFVDSPALTRDWKQRLTGQGYTIQDGADKLTIRGVFRTNGIYGDKGLINTGDLSIGTLVEEALVDRAHEQVKVAKSGTNVYIAPQPSLQATAATSLLATGLSSLMSATGLTDAVDRRLNSFLGTDKDPYKFCMFGCEGEKAALRQPTQAAIFMMHYQGRERTVGVVSYEPVLEPGNIIKEAIDMAMKI